MSSSQYKLAGGGQHEPGERLADSSGDVRLLEDISDLRHRVRARHREHDLADNLGLALSSLLVGVVALVTGGTWAVGQRR